MANRRMFACTVLDTDHFQSLSRDSQFLYIHLGMHADDDGFIGAPLASSRMIGCGKEQLQELQNQGYLIFFPSGVCVIAHWKLHNYIQKDRYTETVYLEEKSHLIVADTGIYLYSEKAVLQESSEKKEGVSDEVLHENAPVSILDTQVRRGEEREGQDSSGEEREDQNRESQDSSGEEREDQNRESQDSSGEEREDQNREGQDSSGEEREERKERKEKEKTGTQKGALTLGAYQNVFLSPAEFSELKRSYPLWESMIENLSVKIQIHGYRYQNHFAVLKKWAQEDSLQPSGGSGNKPAPRAKPTARQGFSNTQPAYDFEAIERNAFLLVNREDFSPSRTISDNSPTRAP